MTFIPGTQNLFIPKMSSKNNKHVENARQFLWDEDESLTSARSRGFHTNQSVNLMDIADQRGVDSSNSNRFASIKISGLFRANTGVEGYLDEYSDAAPSTDSEEYIDNDKRRRNNNRFSSTQRCLTIIMAFTALILVISAIAGTLTKNNTSDDGEGGSGSTGDNRDTNSAATSSSSSSKSPRYVNILTRIVEDDVTPENVFDDTNSPQHKALSWLVNDDPAKLPYSHPNLIDRYVLAVFRYSSSNSFQAQLHDGWKDSTNWMTGTGLCEWYGIECIPREQEATAENEYTPYTKTYNDNSRITGVKLSDNNIIMRTIPAEFGSSALSELLSLDIEDNEIGGTLLKTLGNLPKLRDLLLGGNKFVGTLPNSYESMSNLHQLNLAKNQLEGSIPTSWNQLTKLRFFKLSHNSLTGTIVPHFFSKMRSLGKIFLESNTLRGSLPESLGTLTDLLDLRLDQNNFHGSLTTLSSLQNLETLHVSNNAFTGTIPNMFDQLFRLNELMMQGNQLVGSVPITLTHLQNLKTLNLAHNQLNGEIPAGLGLLTDIVSISLNHNRFSGEIPSLFGKLDDITILVLTDNRLTGTIPTELGACFRMIDLHLDSNRFSGEIPPQLGELSSLGSLKLELNELSGVAMPPQVCALRNEGDLSVLSADCLGDGKVNCECCTLCYS